MAVDASPAEYMFKWISQVPLLLFAIATKKQKVDKITRNRLVANEERTRLQFWSCLCWNYNITASATKMLIYGSTCTLYNVHTYTIALMHIHAYTRTLLLLSVQMHLRPFILSFSLYQFCAYFGLGIWFCLFVCLSCEMVAYTHSDAYKQCCEFRQYA